MNLELDSVKKQQTRIEAQLVELDNTQKLHDQARDQIEAQAAELEGHIRELASQEAVLQQRKRELQDQAKQIGQQRSEYIRRQKELDHSRQALQNQLGQVTVAKQQASAQLAEEAHLREQLAAQDAAWRAAQEAAQQERAERPSPADKRTSTRITVAVDVSYQTEHNFFMGLTENLSEGGLFIATYDSLPLGTQLELTLKLPEFEPIQTRCAVRWVREHTAFTEDVAPGLGVQFLDLTEAQKSAIQGFLKQRDPILYESA